MTNPYLAPTAEIVVESSGDEYYQPKIFAMHGRIGRLRYLAYSMLFTMIGAVLGGVVFGALTFGLGAVPSKWKYALVFLLPLLIIVPAKRRLNDLDHSGWFALLVLIPYVKNLFGLYLVFGRGTDSRNEYGSMPCENPRGMFWVALVIPLIATIGIGIVVAVALPAYESYTQKARAAKPARIQLSRPQIEAPAGADSGQR